MSKTANYQLALWDYGAEDFSPGRVREDWAGNFTKLDTALKAEESARADAVTAEQTARGNAVSTLNTALGKRPELITGTYTGDNTQNRVISLGFSPKAVLALPSDGRITATYSYLGGLALPGKPVSAKDCEMFALTANGFRVSHTSISHSSYNEYISANQTGTVYHYLAFK